MTLRTWGRLLLPPALFHKRMPFKIVQRNCKSYWTYLFCSLATQLHRNKLVTNFSDLDLNPKFSAIKKLFLYVSASSLHDWLRTCLAWKKEKRGSHKKHWHSLAPFYRSGCQEIMGDPAKGKNLSWGDTKIVNELLEPSAPLTLTSSEKKIYSEIVHQQLGDRFYGGRMS